MKKYIRIIALLSVIALTAVSLCSCKALDEAKANQAFYSTDQHREIEYKDSIYRVFSPGKYSVISVEYSDVTVTEKDVPVLVKGWYGNRMSVNTAETVIGVAGSMKDFVDFGVDQKIDDSSAYEEGLDYLTYNIYYVREDLYDEVVKAAQSDQLDHYYFEVWPKGYNYDRPSSSVSHQEILLDDDVTDAIKTAIKETTSKEIKRASDLGNAVNEIEINVCDKNLILTDWNHGGYQFLVQDGDRYYFCYGDSYYLLDQSVYPNIKKLFDTYPDAVYLSDSYYDDYSYEDEDAGGEYAIGYGSSNYSV